MDVWINLPFIPTHELPRLAVAIEQCGVRGLAVSDHVAVPPEVRSTYPYGGGKPVNLATTTEFPDPFVALGAMAAATSRLRVMSAVVVAPLRHPVLLAKATSTVAAISGGRFDLGVGAGWMREEFDAVGVPFEERGRRLDETMQILRQLWTGDEVAFEGTHFAFGPIAMHPAPPEPLSIFVGGHSPAALRRAARLGDGWIGVAPSLDELRTIVATLRQLRAGGPTESANFTIRTGVRGPVMPEVIDQLRQLDVAALIVNPWQLVERGRSIFEISASELPDRVGKLLATIA
jgi:probable F420-dependent oxidoreductase